MTAILATVTLAWLSPAWSAAGGGEPLVVDLWPGQAPDEAGNIGPEKVVM